MASALSATAIIEAFFLDRFRFDQKAAAKMLGIGETKIAELIATGQIEARKLGTMLVLISVESLRAFHNSLPCGRSWTRPFRSGDQIGRHRRLQTTEAIEETGG